MSWVAWTAARSDVRQVETSAAAPAGLRVATTAEPSAGTSAGTSDIRQAALSAVTKDISTAAELETQTAALTVCFGAAGTAGGRAGNWGLYWVDSLAVMKAESLAVHWG